MTLNQHAKEQSKRLEVKLIEQAAEAEELMTQEELEKKK